MVNAWFRAGALSGNGAFPVRENPLESAGPARSIEIAFESMYSAAKNPGIASALRTLHVLSDGLAALPQALEGPLGEAFVTAVDTIRAIDGRVIVTGVGKSGHIGAKIAATLASTGTPAYFVHAAEANHGDLGMITRSDAVLALSWSGETVELKGVLAYAKRFSIPVIAVTWNEKSALGRVADICLTLPKLEEACPHGLAPTTSSMLQLALGDALAISLLESRGFTSTDFKTFHPGGSLGASLTMVREIMHSGDALPVATPDTGMEEAVAIISQKKFGCVIIVDEQGGLAGIVTDGDLRRNLTRALNTMKVRDIMTTNPARVAPDTLASTAIAELNARSITSLVVCDGDAPVGLVHLHDLLRIGVA